MDEKRKLNDFEPNFWENISS